MIQVSLRIAVWLIVIGIGYFIFGPELFDGPGNNKQLTDGRPLFLPPVKQHRLVELENLLNKGTLSGNEVREYQSLVQERRSSFWTGKETSVEAALAGIKSGRKHRLIEILSERGLSGDELAVFLTVVQRDHAHLLEDRE